MDEFKNCLTNQQLIDTHTYTGAIVISSTTAELNNSKKASRLLTLQ